MPRPSNRVMARNFIYIRIEKHTFLKTVRDFILTLDCSSNNEVSLFPRKRFHFILVLKHMTGYFKYMEGLMWMSKSIKMHIQFYELHEG